MPRVAHAFVVEAAHFAFKRLAQRAQAARCVEGFVFHPVQRKMLQALQRQHGRHLALVDGLAGVAIFIDQAVNTPGQVVLQRITRERGQCAHPHFDFVQRIKLLRQMVRDDTDEARRQATLRHESRLCVVGQRHDGLGRRYVFGQIKIMAACTLGSQSHFDGQVVGQGVDHRVMPLQHALQRSGLVGINLNCVDFQTTQFVE